MNQSLRTGCALIAFSPSFFILVMLLSKRPQLVIVALGSAFSWLISGLVTSLSWMIASNIFNGGVWPIVILISSISQELFRFIFVMAYRRTEKIIKASSARSAEVFPLNDVSSSIAAGVGFGTMHSLMMYGALLAASGGKGVIFVDSASSIPLILVGAIISLLFCILDVYLMCFAFMAEKLRSKSLTTFIFLTHLIMSIVTLLNQNPSGCYTSIPILFALIVIVGLFLSWMWPIMMLGVLKSPSRLYH